MALLIDADGEYPGATNIVDTTAFTMMAWFYIVADRGAVAQSLMIASNAPGSDADCYLSWDDNANNMKQGSYDGSGENAVLFASRPAAATWFHAYMRCSGTGANAFQAGWATTSAYVTQQTTLRPGSADSAVNVRFGNDGFGNWSNVRIAAIKMWSASLTDAEIQTERFFQDPIRRANLIGGYAEPTSTVANAVLNAHGTTNNLTATGTMAIAEGPPILMRLEDDLWMPYVVAAAGGGDSVFNPYYYRLHVGTAA